MKALPLIVLCAGLLLVCDSQSQAASQPDFAIRPYITACQQTEAILGWTTETQAEFTVRWGLGDKLDRVLTAQAEALPLEYAIRPADQLRVRPPANTALQTNFQYLVRLADLAPDTTYGFEVTGAGLSAKGSFATLLPPGKPFTFIAYADTQDPKIHTKLARQFPAFKPRLAVLAGDTIDDSWLPFERTDFFDPLDGLAARIPFFPAVGNHDSGANLVRLFRQGNGKTHYAFDCGDVHFVVLDSFLNAQNTPTRLEWLERDLAASKARWKIVISHIPSYDAGIHNYRWGRDNFLPLYRKHGVDLVLNGHTHNYQRAKPMLTPGENDKHPITFMVIGGGGGSLHLLPTEPALAAGAQQHHFLVFDASPTKLAGRCFSMDGQQLDAFEINKDASGNMAADWVRQAVPESSWGTLRAMIFPYVKQIGLSGDPTTGEWVKSVGLQLGAGDKAMKFSFRMQEDAGRAYDLKPVSGEAPAGGVVPVVLELKLRDPSKFNETLRPPLLRVECLFEVDGVKASIFSGKMVPVAPPQK